MAVADLDIPGLCNCTKLRSAARHVSRFYDAQLAGSGLRITQYAILGHLKLRGPKSMLELAELMTMDRTTIGRDLRPLERDGLVKIEVSPTDRRIRLVSITKAGLERVAIGWPGWDRAQAEFEAEFGAANAVAMREMMDHVVACGLRKNSAFRTRIATCRGGEAVRGPHDAA
jgi:DNA-binding MarR family transcriptional regulator